MEGGASFHGFPGLPRPGSGTPDQNSTSRNSSNGGGDAGGGCGGGGDGSNNSAVREQDRFMPIANVIRIMRKVLPTHAKISDDAKETIQECVSEYISFITSEANDRCQREQRKTITAEDVLWAMSKLGFDDYIEPLSIYLHRYRELEGDHRGSIRGEPLPIKRGPLPQHDPAAAAPLYGPLMPPHLSTLPPPSFHVPPPTGFPHLHPHLGAYGEGMGGYYLGMYGGGGDGAAAGASSSQLPMPNFDPYAPYK